MHPTADTLALIFGNGLGRRVMPGVRPFPPSKAMKSAEQLLDFVTHRIGHIYFRPRMYGGTAEGVELILDNYHELWAEVTEQREQFQNTKREVLKKGGYGSMGFAFRCRRDKPDASEQECAEYVVEQWRKISKRLGVPVPYSAIRDTFKDKEGLRDKFPDER